MAAIPTLSAQGRITIPRVIRKLMGLKPGDKIAFELCQDGALIIQPKNRRGLPPISEPLHHPRFLMHPLLTSLIAMRQAKHLTQGELASHSGLSRTAIQHAESGETDPRFSTLFEMARALDMDIIAVPRPLRQELEWFIQSGGKVLGHPPGISAPLSAVDELLRENKHRR